MRRVLHLQSALLGEFRDRAKIVGRGLDPVIIRQTLSHNHHRRVDGVARGRRRPLEHRQQGFGLGALWGSSRATLRLGGLRFFRFGVRSHFVGAVYPPEDGFVGETETWALENALATDVTGLRGSVDGPGLWFLWLLSDR